MVSCPITKSLRVCWFKRKSIRDFPNHLQPVFISSAIMVNTYRKKTDEMVQYTVIWHIFSCTISFSISIDSKISQKSGPQRWALEQRCFCYSIQLSNPTHNCFLYWINNDFEIKLRKFFLLTDVAPRKRWYLFLSEKPVKEKLTSIFLLLPK